MTSLTWAVVLLAGLTCSTHALGTQTTIEDYPQVAQVEYNVASTWSQQCTCIILTNYHCVGAASCYRDIITNRRVRAGSSYRNTGGEVRELSSVINHPTYGTDGENGNIAVTRVRNSFYFGPNISPGAIVPSQYHIPEGQAVTLVAWGSTAEGNLISNNQLYELGLETQNINDCSRKLAEYDDPRVVTTNMLCTGLPQIGGRDLDPRDAGAPLFYHGAVCGFAIFGSSRSNDNIPIVATAITAYTQWIIEHAI